MMCYRDRQWCNKYEQCQNGDDCDRALTPKVQELADEWWGKGEHKAPIDIGCGHPKCFVAKRTIVCAALFYSGTIFVGNKHVQGLVITGARHYDSLMLVQIRLMGLPRTPAPVQGFVDQFGCFVGREEAMGIVKNSGQRFNEERNGVPANELFSEGLY